MVGSNLDAVTEQFFIKKKLKIYTSQSGTDSEIWVIMTQLTCGLEGKKKCIQNFCGETYFKRAAWKIKKKTGG